MEKVVLCAGRESLLFVYLRGLSREKELHSGDRRYVTCSRDAAGVGGRRKATKEIKPISTPLARKLVTQCARVRDGDVVQIQGGVRDIELLENIWVETAKLGADVIVTLAPCDQTFRRLFADVPAQFDSRTSSVSMSLAKTITVLISVTPWNRDQHWQTSRPNDPCTVPGPAADRGHSSAA